MSHKRFSNIIKSVDHRIHVNMFSRNHKHSNNYPVILQTLGSNKKINYKKWKRQMKYYID